MDNEPTNQKINPIVLAVLVLFALIGLAALLVWVVQILVNVIIDDYTNHLFSFGEALALTALIVTVSGLIGTAAANGKKG